MKTYKQKHIVTFFGLIFLVFTFVACTEEVNLDYETLYNGLVVNAKITTDTTTQKVILSKSGDPLNRSAIQYVSNAIVTITDGTNTFNLSENDTLKGVYETAPNVYGVPGKKYVLNISNVDINNDGIMETYSAESLLEKINPIDSITIVSQNFDAENRGWAVNLYSQDIGGGRDYYLVKVKVNTSMVTDSLQEYSIASNGGFEGQYYDGLTVYFLNNGKTDERLTPGDTVTLELDGITEGYYNFVDGYKQEYFPKNPIFSGPSANVTTNIMPKNNASGYFVAYSIQRKRTVFK